jgi:hypothetical protein
MERWKASNPAGTSGTAYIIRHKLPEESAFSFIGVSGKKEFIDDTLIAGPDSVQYTVQGQRADSSGPVSPIFTVMFGQAPGGGLTAMVTSGVSASTVDGQPVRKVLPTGTGGRRGRGGSGQAIQSARGIHYFCSLTEISSPSGSL